MKNPLFFLLIFLFLAPSLQAQDWISIIGKSPYPQGVKVYFTGFDGFEELDLGSIRTTEGGEIDYFTDYHGRCRMSAEGMPSYYLILEHDPVCIEWDQSRPFTCDPENEYFHEMVVELEYIDSLYADYQDETDSLAKEEAYLAIEDAMQFMYEEVSISKIMNARTFLLAELLIRRAKLASDPKQMTAWKEDMLDFIGEGYDILRRSNYPAAMAGAYLAMNKSVLKSETSILQAMEYDVATWMEQLGPEYGEKEMLEFFMIHFLETGEPGLAAKIASGYNEVVKCEQFISSKLRNPNMPYTFNVFGGEDFSRVYNLDQFYGMPKVLAMVSTECPASVAAVAGLYDFLMENQIRMPVILVPDMEPEGKLAELLSSSAPFGLQAGVKTGGTLMFGAGVEQLPAFMLLDNRNIQQEVFYDLEDLKPAIGGEQ